MFHARVWSNDDLAEYSTCNGLELATHVKNGDVSPRENVTLGLQAVELANPVLNHVLSLVRSGEVGVSGGRSWCIESL